MRSARNYFNRYFVALFAFSVASGVSVMATTPAGHSAPQKDDGGKTASVASTFTPDKGKFRIVLDGHAVGDEEFEISASGSAWTARGVTTAHVPGGAEIKATGQLKISADGTPIRYEWSAEAQKKAIGAVDFVNGTAKCSANLGAASPLMKDFKFDSPRIAVLDNNLYHQYALLAQVYDWKSGGKQSFPVVIPQDLTPGSISVESIGPQPVENIKYEALRVSSTDLEIMLYVDAKHHLMRMEVPASKVVIERE
jgi:hypothetical protein